MKTGIKSPKESTIEQVRVFTMELGCFNPTLASGIGGPHTSLPSLIILTFLIFKMGEMIFSF